MIKGSRVIMEVILKTKETRGLVTIRETELQVIEEDFRTKAIAVDLRSRKLKRLSESWR